MWDVGGVFGGVIGSSAEPAGDVESVLSSVRLSFPSAGCPERYAERRDAPLRPNAALRWDWREGRGDDPSADGETTSLAEPTEGGLRPLEYRGRSSTAPLIYVSVPESGTVTVSEPRAGATEFRSGTRTDSSINSYMILTAG